MNTLKAERRDLKTKAKQLRREGYVTGNVFGKDIEGSIPLQYNVLQAEAFLKENWEGSKAVLELDGEQMPVIVKEVQFNFLLHQYVELDFQTIPGEKRVKIAAEKKPAAKKPAAKKAAEDTSEKKPAEKKAPARKTAEEKPAEEKPAEKKTTAKKPAAKEAAEDTAEKKPTEKKAPAKKTAEAKPAAKKPAAKKTEKTAEKPEKKEEAAPEA